MREGMGCPVEIEFAVDMGDWGRMGARRDRRLPTLYVLQVRPLATTLTQQQIQIDSYQPDELLCRTHLSLGHMMRDDVRDIVYVTDDEDPSPARLDWIEFHGRGVSLRSVEADHSH